MRVKEEIIETRNLRVVNFCCKRMKYQIDIGNITFTETGFFIFDNQGFDYCLFCGKKIDYE